MRIRAIILFPVFLIIFSHSLWAQNNFRTRATGDWNNSDTWEEETSPSVWTNTTNTPDNTSGTILIQNGHTVTVTADVIVDQTTIESGGVVTVNNSVTLYINDDFSFSSLLTVDSGGTINNNGTLDWVTYLVFSPSEISGVINNTGTITSGDPSFLSFMSGSTYNHLLSSGGDIPIATWDINSTCVIAGMSSGSAIAPNNLNQTFGNFTVDATNFGNTLFDLGGQLTSVTGNLTFQSSASIRHCRLQASGGSGYTLNVGGDFSIGGSSGVVVWTGVSMTSNAIINVTGNYSQTAGNFVLWNSGSNDVTINIGGNFSRTAGTISKTGSGTGNGIISFNGTGSQTFTNSLTFAGGPNFIVGASSDLLMGTSYVTGTGTFTLNTGGTIEVGSPDGINSGTSLGNIRVSGTRTYNSGTIVYNGASAQVMGDGFPSTGNVNLTINNSNGVSMSSDVTINSGRTLTFTSGSLTIGAYTLTIDGSLSGTASLVGSSSSNLSIGGTSTFGTIAFTGSTELNNLTLNRTAGSVTLGSSLTVNGTFTHTAGTFIINGQSLTLFGDYTPTSGNFTSNSTSSLVLDGTGTNGVMTFTASSALQTLTMHNTNGGTIASAITIQNDLFLTHGILGGVGTLFMAAGSTITRDAGSTTMIISPVSSYNVVYEGATATSTGNELPTSSTALNDLTINNTNQVTLASDITINGVLTVNGGSFPGSSNAVTVNGNLISNGPSDFSSNTTTFDGTTAISGAVALTFNIVTVSGTLTAPSGSLTINGTIDMTGGTFDANGGTVILGGTQTITSAGNSFNNLTVGGSGTKTLADALDVNGNLSITSTLSAGAVNISIAGNYTNSGTLSVTTNTVTLDGSNQNITPGSSAFNNLTIGGTGTKTMMSNLDINTDLTITSTLSVGADYTINLGDDWINNGTFVANNGTVIFDGTGQQDISGSGVTTFHNISVTNSTGGPPEVRVLTTHQMNGVLTLVSNSEFAADGGGSGSFTLLSDATQDAAIATLPSGASVSGNVTVQRYMAGEGKIWRYLAPTVTGATVAGWQDDFPITGTFTGASTCSGCSTNPSMYIYTESTLGNADQGYTAYPVTSNTESLTNGTGYAAFIREGTLSTTVDLTGPIRSGNFAFSITYTDDPGQPATEDGWNLLGNPYPAALDWDLLWNDAGTSGVDPTIHIRDNGSGGLYATYNASLGTGTNGGTKDIAIGQGFWIQTNASSPSLTATEAMKVTSTPTFFRIGEPENILRIALNNDIIKDETIIGFRNDATPEKDIYDSYKLMNSVFNLSSLMGDEKMVFNVTSIPTCDLTEDLDISNTDPGNYHLDFSGFDSFNFDVNYTLVDNYTGQNVDIKTNPVYQFEINTDTLSQGKRFQVIFSQPEIIDTLAVEPLTDQVCGSGDFTFQIDNTQNNITYKVLKNGLDVTEPVAGDGSNKIITVISDSLEMGANNLEIWAGREGCAYIPLLNGVSLTLNDTANPPAIVSAANCGPGSLTLTASSDQDVVFLWYDSNDPSAQAIEDNSGEFNTGELSQSKTYFVSTVTPAGCESERVEVLAVINDLPEISNTFDGFGCYDTSIALKAEGAPENGKYSWYESADATDPIEGEESSVLITPQLQQSRSYFVSAISEAGCEGSRVEVQANVFKAEIETNGDTLISNSDTGNQWFFNGEPVTGATGQEFVVTKTGTYSLEVSVYGCLSEANVEMVVTGLQEDGNSGIQIYPNPTNNIISVKLDDRTITGSAQLVIYDLTGKVYIQKKDLYPDSDNIITIDVSSLARGSYLLKIWTGNFLFNAKILKE